MRTRRHVIHAAAAVLLLGVAVHQVRGHVWSAIPLSEPAPPPDVTSAVEVNGVSIHYSVWGHGDPVVLLHGGLGNSDAWGAQVNFLARGHKVIAIDSRGHGRSSWDGHKLTYELMASDVLGVLDHLKLHKVSVIGWSDGGIIALVLAMSHPERLKRVFAFGANVDPAGLTPDDVLDQARERLEQEEDGAAAADPDDGDAFLWAVRAMWATEPHYTPADLARIRVPVTIADGSRDDAIYAAHTEMMAHAIPGARLVILPGLGHVAMREDPAVFNRALAEFLAN